LSAGRHSALTTIVEDGKEIKILRDNAPFGRAGHGEFGTYFIGYSGYWLRNGPRTAYRVPLRARL
jgi:deferrochelatase/peroxidase EfeB